MITFSNKFRSQQIEIMDNLEFQGLEMENVLKDLKTVNKCLGGNNISIDGIQKLLKHKLINAKIIILDVGCGDGELLRQCADFGFQNNLNFELIGIDFNENILKLAKSKSKNYPNIRFSKVDILSKDNLIPNCDIALCTLFLHHFGNEKILEIIKKLLQRTQLGVVINDLERSKIAFNLFKIASYFFLKTKTARYDGLVSVARGFKKQELEKMSKDIPYQHSNISKRWAFRFQWILKKHINGKDNNSCNATSAVL